MYNNDDDQVYRRLIILLKLFKSRHHHLAKYLIDNSALDSKFITHLLNSDKLVNEIKMDENFSSISEMEEYFNSLIDVDKKSELEIERELNDKLNNFINEENYEEAAKLRDYMIIKDVKRINL